MIYNQSTEITGKQWASLLGIFTMSSRLENGGSVECMYTNSKNQHLKLHE